MVKQFAERKRVGNYLIPVSRLKSHGGYREERSTYGYGDENRKMTKLSVLRVEEYSDLYLSILNEPARDSPGGYKYIITTGAQSHTAFSTERGFKRFLARTGLKSKFVSRSNYGTHHRLIGKYQRIGMAGNWKLLNEFGRKNGLKRTKLMDNGDYTTGWYGNGKIYYLNPNYPRTIYNHFWE